jgi:hypothetical protein
MTFTQGGQRPPEIRPPRPTRRTPLFEGIMVDVKVKTMGAREGKGGEKKEDKIDLLNRRRPGASPMRQVPAS